jgi:uncharacterized lipoprotein YajG
MKNFKLDKISTSHHMNKVLSIIIVLLFLNACSTTVAVIDVTGSAVVYAGKTIVNTVDMLTPDIVNKK